MPTAAEYHNIMSSFRSHASNDVSFQPSSSLSSAYAAQNQTSPSERFKSHAAASGAVPVVSPSTISAKPSFPPGIDPNTGLPPHMNGGGSPPMSANASPSPTDIKLPYDYVDSSIASLYGMDAATQYQEALSTTAYQRAVKDLRAAGLNPVLGISGNGASVFGGTAAPVASSGSGSGSGYGSMNSGKATAADIAYKLGNVLPGLANAAASIGVVVGSHGKGAAIAPFVGYAAQNATTSILNAIKNFG